MPILGGQQYIPAVTVATSVATVQNLDALGLEIRWDVTRTVGPEADMGEVTIVNLGQTIASGIHESWRRFQIGAGFKLTLSVGWDGVPKRLMKADVWDIAPKVREIPDVLTTFKLGDGIDPLRDQMVGKTFHGAKISEAIDWLVSIVVSAQDIGGGGLGLTYPAESRALVAVAASATPFSRFRNIPAGLSTREHIATLMATIGLTWRVQNGAFIAMRNGAIKRPGPILRPGTGLISYQVRNDGGITLQALTDAEVEPGIQLQVQDDERKPFGALLYRVERVRFFGSTRAESLMEIEAAKAVLV